MNTLAYIACFTDLVIVSGIRLKNLNYLHHKVNFAALLTKIRPG
jgi:hypothetical protein